MWLQHQEIDEGDRFLSVDMDGDRTATGTRISVNATFSGTTI